MEQDTFQSFRESNYTQNINFQHTTIYNDILGNSFVYINEMNTLIFNFLWNGRDKIKRETLYQDFSKGGLNVPSKQKTR